MATGGKRLHAMSIVGIVFMLSGVVWLAVGKPALAAVMLAVGTAICAAGVTARRKAAAAAAGGGPPANGERPG